MVTFIFDGTYVRGFTLSRLLHKFLTRLILIINLVKGVILKLLIRWYHEHECPMNINDSTVDHLA